MLNLKSIESVPIDIKKFFYKEVFMIILLHGTGDDSSKVENWIRYVAEIMTKHGESVLVVAGCGSDAMDENEVDQGQSSIAPQALAFIETLGVAKDDKLSKADKILGMNSAQRNCFDYPKLLDALNDAGGHQFPRAARVPAGHEEDLIRQLQEEKKADGPVVGTGIKYRAAVASICAIAYQRRFDNPRPIRIIGHSRGGSNAVAIHNILTYHGLYCSTLTLDPCHGKAKIIEKEYYKKIWAGKLVNMPNNKNVGWDHLPDFVMCRPAITVGEGGSADITSYERLMNIKHGHMGKLRGFSSEEKTDGTKVIFGREIERWLASPEAQIEDPQYHLLSFFKKFIDSPTSPVGEDKRAIATQVIELLTGPIPVTRGRSNAFSD